MTMKTKSFLRFAVLLSSMLAAGGSASWAGGFPHSALNSGFTAAEPGYATAGAAGYQPVTMTSAEMPNCGSALSSALASPDMQYSGRPMGTAMASPAETGQSTAGKAKQGGEPLNDYFDSFEVAPPTGIGRGMVYAGEYYPGVSCFPATVQSGLLPAAGRRAVPELFFCRFSGAGAESPAGRGVFRH